jgi:exopolyphosphatase / guanosine-5'-triphosphate,3'-diphosphate pyrophosphatase
VRRLQAVDIGTNSVRSIIVEVPVGGAHHIIDDEKAMTRLGSGLDATGMLDPEAVERTVVALKAMMDIGRSMGADDVRAIATEAVRRASNGAELVQRLKDEAGLNIEIISAEEEGRLVWLSASSLTKDMPASVVVDVGGGSVEVVQAMGAEPLSIVSMRLGARVMTERFLAEDPPSDASFKALKRHVRRTLADSVAPLEPGITTLVGSGGTVTSIAAIIAGMRGQRYESLHGLEIERPEIMQLLGILSHSTAEQRAEMPGMPPDRIDIVLAGALVLAEVLKLFGASAILVNALGIREGIVLDTLASDGAIDPTPDHRRTVREVGQRYGYDREHAEHVTELSLSLFDQLSEPLRLGGNDRVLLESAAMLHDIGYYISYDRHHKHSYHLILNSGLRVFTRRERAIVAAIARYHTKALPKRSHESMIGLDPADRATVRRLAAILRIADGFDRGRSARVSAIDAVDDGVVTRFTAHSDDDLHAELYGVDKKKDLYEETFGRTVEVAVAGRE